MRAYRLEAMKKICKIIFIVLLSDWILAETANEGWGFLVPGQLTVEET